MTKYAFRLTALSPWFLNGAEPRGQPELRASAVRGGLRYWLRAVKGAETTNLAKIWDVESATFGSTGRGSAVTVRVFGKTPPIDRVAMMPHRTERQSFTAAIMPMYAATLELVTRPGLVLPADALAALKIWSLLGGIGKRSRRMFGAVDVRANADDTPWYAPPTSPAALSQIIQETLTEVVKPVGQPAIPPFPTLHPQHSWVIVGRQVYENALDANVDLFRELLRTSRFRASEQTFGQATGGRRSSPLIAQVRWGGEGVVPVLTALRSTPDRNIKWTVLCDFMEAAAQQFDGVTVWGGRFA